MSQVIICRLSSRLLNVASSALKSYNLRPAKTLTDVLRIILKRQATAILVEPMEHEDSSIQLKWIKKRFPAIRIVGFLQPTNSSFRIANCWLKLGIEHLVIAGATNTEAYLKEYVTAPAYHSSMALLNTILGNAIEIAEPVCKALNALFDDPSSFLSVHALAIEAGISRRQFDHYLRASGLASAHTLLMAAHLCRAYEHLMNPGMTATKVAELLGYSDLRVLNSQSRRAFGHPITRIRSAMNQNEMVEKLIHLCCPYIRRETTELISSTS